MVLMPGISPRDLKRLMKRMGINVEELRDVEKVEIILKDKKIVIDSPQVVALRSRTETIYQIIGTPKIEERKIVETEVEVSEDDIRFLIEQTGASWEEARKALIEAGGDIAEAILKLKGG